MKVICYGDSNTFGYDPRCVFGDPYASENRWVDILAVKTGWNVVNQGVNGQEIPQMPVSFPTDTDFLIIMLGTNDLLQCWTPEEICGKMERFLESLMLDQDKILLIAPPPMKLGEWVQDQELINASITLTKHYQTLTKRLGVRFVDSGQWNTPLAYDGVHLTEEGHRAFAEGLLNYLNRERTYAERWHESTCIYPDR